LSKKVGIPRGLFYYKYFPLWKTFLEELGAEVVVSDFTNKRILDDGVKSCVGEACLPVKLFHGHVLNLADRVDYILIPRLTSISRNEYVCPEFGGLPDMIKHTLRNLPPLISTEVDLRKSGRNSWKAALETGRYFTDDKYAIKRAFNKALYEYRKFRKATLTGELPYDPKGGLQADARKLKIAVIGHVYNIYDKYINMDMLKKLRDFGVEAITVDMVDEADINRSAGVLNKPMFWNFGRKAMGSALYLIEKNVLDGIIYVMSFGCGIDSFVCDLIERKVRRDTDLPFIVLTLDEHSGEAGINTRLEAFIDMIGWRKADENNVPAPG
jgi:predicted nucleotide-binding protein (sugar kinase/HSP70/actin superfamily)